MLTMAGEFGSALDEVLAERGISRYRLAADSKISQSHLTNVALGKRQPTADMLDKLAAVLTLPQMQKLRKAAAQEALAAKGLLDTEGTPPVQESESVTVKLDPLVPIEQMGLRRLPRFESVACGWGALADEHPIDWDTWPASIAKDADHTVVARGESMRDAGISDGDLVFVRKTALAPRRIPSGTTVIAHQGDGEYLCKKLYHDRRVSWLQGQADGHLVPIYLHERPEIRIVGIVTGVFKSMG